MRWRMVEIKDMLGNPPSKVDVPYDPPLHRRPLEGPCSSNAVTRAVHRHFASGVPRSSEPPNTRCLPSLNDDRESVRGKIGGRTHEISRLIGRCLRGVIDMKALGENQIQLDVRPMAAPAFCNRCTWSVNWAEKHRHIVRQPRAYDYVCGTLKVCPIAVVKQTDMNVAMTGSGTFIEIQGTAEHRPFNRAELGTLLDLAEKGNKELQAAQRAALSLD